MPLNRRSKRRREISHERRILLLAFAASLPAVIVALVILWHGDYSSKVQWTLTVLVAGAWLGFALSLRERVVRPLQTLSNILAALREGDYSIRARGARWDDALGEVMIEVNALGDTLKEQRLGALEATALLRTVMEEIDVAVFAFDGDQRLQLVNRAGERLLSQPAERIIGQSAEDLELKDCLEGEAVRTLTRSFPGQHAATARWGMHRSTFREGGLPHQLLVLSDVSRALREEELQAWQRLVRVLGHELNNSLTPIRSMAGSLESLLTRQPRADDWEQDMRQGLRIIGTRAEALSRFMGAYARLARLPRPTVAPVDVGAWVRRVVGLETRMRIELVPGPEFTVRADADQLEQLLINLVRNAVDAAEETHGEVRVGWAKNGRYLEVWVEDSGPGLANTGNLFVPFFTTKPAGSGIGLVLSRQIAEAHGGTLSLENRASAPGCEARLRLPL